VNVLASVDCSRGSGVLCLHLKQQTRKATNKTY